MVFLKIIKIGLDYSHGGMLSLEAPSYADFTQFLFASAYKLGKIEAGLEDKHYNIEQLYKISKALDVPMCRFFEDIEDL